MKNRIFLLLALLCIKTNIKSMEIDQSGEEAKALTESAEFLAGCIQNNFYAPEYYITTLITEQKFSPDQWVTIINYFADKYSEPIFKSLILTLSRTNEEYVNIFYKALSTLFSDNEKLREIMTAIYIGKEDIIKYTDFILKVQFLYKEFINHASFNIISPFLSGTTIAPSSEYFIEQLTKYLNLGSDTINYIAINVGKIWHES